ncbi:MAG: sec-independent protein translocase protein TatB [Arenicella sp.]|jgi:sec-independent protein translocase protein TatB
MFDIGFWELLVIAIVLLLVMGPERLPEVARQAAFLLRKARQGMFRLRNEMQSEMGDTPFSDLQKARQEMTDLKNDFKQFGRELADSAEQKPDLDGEPNSAASGSGTHVKGSSSAKASAVGDTKPQVSDAGDEGVPKTDDVNMPAGSIATDAPVGDKR